MNTKSVVSATSRPSPSEKEAVAFRNKVGTEIAEGVH
jgi:hypothetical protein